MEEGKKCFRVFFVTVLSLASALNECDIERSTYRLLHGSNIDWETWKMVKMYKIDQVFNFKHFAVRESQEIFKTLEKSGKFTQNTRKVWEF